MNITDNCATGHETRDEVSAARRIRWALAQRPAMHIGELCLRLGLKEDDARAALERMSGGGEVELLRPIDCRSGADDFFRLCEVEGRHAVYRETGRATRAVKPDDYVLAGIVG